jgi:GMP synthase (glutamine-hydrolysing)
MLADSDGYLGRYTRSPRALIVQHHPAGDAGRLTGALSAAGFEIDTVRTDLGGVPPRSLTGYGAYVSMGGEMFVSDMRRHPFIGIEQRLFRTAIATDTPAVGICLGAQILASALGAEVSGRWQPQIGWQCVRVEARDDPLVGSLAPEAFVFEWHHQSFDLPAGATRLATSDAVPTQAFRRGSAWALQFHLEIEARHVEAWSGSAGGQRELRKMGISRRQMLAELRDRLPLQLACADQAFGTFAAFAADHAAESTGPLSAPSEGSNRPL